MFEDNVVFHYTKSETVINYILKNKTLKFGSFKTVNDPREAKTWPFKFYCLKSENGSKFDYKLFDQVHEFIMSRAHVLCFSLNDSKDKVQMENLELSEGWANHRMWAQYGDNHKGVCLVFDKHIINSIVEKTHNSSLHFNEEIVYANKNEYRIGNVNDPYLIEFEAVLNIGLDNYMREHVKKFYKELFFLKHKVWREERELRYVIFSDKTNEEYYIPIIDSIKAIILGEDFEEEFLEDIILTAEKLRVDLYRMYTRGWAVHLFKIEKNDVNALSLNGLSYPTHFYYELLFAQACGVNGKRRTILIDFPNNGAVKVMD